ncbi:MAG: hypothetical protein E7101_02645 [Prevotella ruminicola]|uniref:Uncharacterized protein n=1 Tax=Xylanibacter ruminicola TaxID=839 RepID=A0A9D5P2W2_XYLRU|nr:hypothetical protein [Xylanibacter ruminicola]
MKTRVKLSFNLILTLALWLVAAQGAWAATETRTVTFYMDGGASGNTSAQDDWTLVSSSGKTLNWSNDDPDNNKITWRSKQKTASFRTNVIKCNGVIEFPNLEGTVKSVELTNFMFYDSGMQMYVGLNKNNTSTLLHLHGSTNDYDFPSNGTFDYSNSATFEGNLAVSASNPLKIMFSSEVEEPSGSFIFKEGTIVITYDVEVEDTSDPGHTFTFSTSGNTLTATCNQTSQHHNCALGTSRKSTLALTANNASYNGLKHSATLNLTDFLEETGITDINTTLNYTNNATSESIGTAPSEIGSYTVTATIIINKDNEHPYVLTTNFSIMAGFNINNKYSQFKLNKSSALEGDEVTITYTQKMDETIEGLTLTGATSGNNITYTQSGNTYTFNMPAEDVNLSATFTYPLNENNITQSGDTYTIKTAEGWNYFCQRLEVDGDLNGFSGKTVMLGDNITVTTMAGSTDHPFKGMFDGDGHTLTFNYTADMPNCAPFHITNGATIRNLHATGLIEGGIWHNMGGLVGSASGNLTIENCRVSTQISSTINGEAGHGGIVGYIQYTNYLVDCNITGCVYDGLIYNSNTWNQTYGCGGFIGAMSQYAYVDLTDCLFLHGQYDNNGNKCELLWGYDNDRNSTFFHRSNGYGEGKLTNCFYVGTRGLKQGSPAVESADAPDNFAHFGDPTTDHSFLKVYGHTMVFDGKYYTPTYGDLVETYSYSGEKSYIIEYDDMPLGIKDVKTKQRTNYLRYNRPFTRDKAVTIMLPFDFTKNDIRRGEYDNISEGKFYEFAGIEEVPFNMWIAVMKEVGVEGSNETTETTMKANTPYLFMPGEDAKYLYFTNGDDYYQGFDIFTEGYERGNKQTEYDGSDGTYSWNKWNFKGTYQPRYWSDSENSEEIGKVYGFAGATKEVDEQLVVAGDFVRVKSGAKIRPTSCYLEWVKPEDSEQEPNSASARRMTRSASNEVELPQRITVKLISASGETTAIGTLDTKTGEVTFDSEAWYTLDGVRLSGKPSSKGIYINNGKKIVIK